MHYILTEQAVYLVPAGRFGKRMADTLNEFDVPAVYIELEDQGFTFNEVYDWEEENE